MTLPSLTSISGLLIASEFLLAVWKRSGSGGGGKDRYTLPLLWLVIGVSIWMGFELRARVPSGRFSHPLAFYLAGLALFVLGLIIRWAAIIHLGRFFTVNVAIAEDHQLITTGPYRFVRHPSYTGSFFIFLGFGLCTLNIFALGAILLPISVAFLWRIHVEEMALRENFGDRYREYAARTNRVIPLIW